MASRGKMVNEEGLKEVGRERVDKDERQWRKRRFQKH